MGRTRARVAALALASGLALGSFGCAERPPKVPGETDTRVSSVEIAGKDGAELALDFGPLVERLGMRHGTLLVPDRFYSPFREAEDRRRLAAYWQTYGYFDVEVDPPQLSFNDDHSEVGVGWVVREGPRYHIAARKLVFPASECPPVPDPDPQRCVPAYAAELEAMVPFEAGETEVDLERFRKVREDMADVLRRAGRGHAMVYSRTYVDRVKKALHWYYFVDAGPETTVGKVVVEGNRRIPDELVIERAGMHPGDPYDLGTKLRAEYDLLDTGAFASTFIRTTADTKFIVPGDAPDTGGELRDEQIDAHGDLVARRLPKEIDLKVHVVEAPSVQVRVRAGVEADPDLVDTAVGTEISLRNAFAPQHHLEIEGRIGYGWPWKPNPHPIDGLFGDALVRYLHPGLDGRLLDLRVTARFRDQLYPGFHLRELTVGPGLRSTLAEGLFVDVDLMGRYARSAGFGPFDDAAREALSLPDDERSYGAELSGSILWDRRDNPIEARSGTYLGLRATLSPGKPLGTHRYFTLDPEVRGFLPLTEAFSLGARAAAGFVFGADDAGVPLGPRLFGGGSFGMRGFGRYHLSPLLPPACVPGDEPNLTCLGGVAGGLSLFEGSLEARLLPFHKPYGGVLFVDVGGAGGRYNPFAEGVSLALGLGARLRLWYLPIALDFAYQLLDRNELRKPPEDHPLLVFFRVGEAF